MLLVRLRFDNVFFYDVSPLADIYFLESSGCPLFVSVISTACASCSYQLSPHSLHPRKLCAFDLLLRLLFTPDVIPQ